MPPLSIVWVWQSVQSVSLHDCNPGCNPDSRRWEEGPLLDPFEQAISSLFSEW